MENKEKLKKSYFRTVKAVKKNLSINRRRFLKYAAAVVVAVGAAALGVYHSGRRREDAFTSRPPTTIQTIETLKTTEKTNRPPELPLTCVRKGSPPILICKEALEIWPKYINPTTEYEIKLDNNAYDPDGDPLTITWLIDGEEVSHEPKYSTKLPEGEHLIGLRVSDGMEERGAETRVTVEPDQIYPVRELKTSIKGISYFVDIRQPSTRLIGAMEEHLDVIYIENLDVMA